MQIWDCGTNDPWQQWIPSVDVATGAAFLKNVGSNKCLDDMGSTSPGAAPGIWDCNSGLNQKWHMAGGFWRPQGTSFQIVNGDAYVLLAGNGTANTALDSGFNYTNGNKPSLASAIDGDVANQVHIVPGSAANTWTIKFVGGNGNKCLDEPASQLGNYTTLQVWDCNGGTNQNWYINNDPAGGVILKNQASNRCLTNSGANGGGNGTPPCVVDCSTTDYAQFWGLTAN